MPNVIYWISISSVIVLGIIYIYWRFFFFYRNPERKTPSGMNIVAPADGTVVYIKKNEKDEVPISIKKRKVIKLNEIFNYNSTFFQPSYIIGIFMHPSSVHVNRAPIDGVVEKIIYTKNRNLPMTFMWWRVLLGIKPYELCSNHILQNERNTILIRGKIPIFIVQIADIYVNKIECWVKEGDQVEKGQRLGMIKMGSQVDTLLPFLSVSNILVKVGEKVKAGETILASLN